MINQNNLYQIISDSKSFDQQNITQRHAYNSFLRKNIDTKPIKVITGFRRSGKSFLLKQLAHYLETQKQIAPENIFFINLEHDLLFNNRLVKDLRDLFELYRTTIWKKGKIYVFLDEIQLIKGWESFVRTIYESGQDKFDIYITGSNSDLLSSEFSSSLAGRVIESTVYPFSFKEYLLYNQLNIKSEKDFYTNKILIKQLFNEYLYYGGIVESFSLNKNFKKTYFESLFRKVLIDDIVNRFNIENVKIIEDLYKFIISDIGSILSLKNIQNSLLRNHQKISLNTLYAYVEYLMKAYSIFELKKFDWKLHNVFDTSNKYFLIDNGIMTSMSVNKNDFQEKLLENIVFLQLLRTNKEIYYARDDKGKEIDFLIREKKDYTKIQVSLEINSKNTERELNNFLLATKHNIQGKNLLITLDDNEEIINYKDIKIEKKNIIKWLLFESKSKNTENDIEEIQVTPKIQSKMDKIAKLKIISKN